MSALVSPPGPAAPSRVGPRGAAALDVVLVVLFAAIGRASHAEENPILGALGTAWPFLVGAAAGWGLVRWRSGGWPLRVGSGIPVWAGALVIGMTLRVLTGDGTAPSFVLVAGIVLAVFVLGWRALAQRIGRRRSPRQAGGHSG
ncbi:MAG: DUF3054 domain-containing protein [Dermatophilaceae bacterium]